MRADDWGRKARAVDDLGVYGKPVPLPSSRAGLQLPLPMTSARQLVDYPRCHLTKADLLSVWLRVIWISLCRVVVLSRIENAAREGRKLLTVSSPAHLWR